MPLQPGFKLLSRYTIQALIGEGGMCRVYRAFDTFDHMRCAIKEHYLGGHIEENTARKGDDDRTIQHQDEPGIDASQQGDEADQVDDPTRKRSKPRISTARRQQLAEKFEYEARILHEMDHPNLPKVYNYFVLGDYCYLVESWIDGIDLEEFLNSIKNAPIPEGKILKWMQQILDALTYCHQEKGVIHRDIKPGNIKITNDDKAYLLDFGIARTFKADKAAGYTPPFAPPEQYTGEADERSDVYALGATLYNLLTGETPIDARERQAGTTLKPPRSIVPTIKTEIDNLVMKVGRTHLNFPTEQTRPRL